MIGRMYCHYKSGSLHRIAHICLLSSSTGFRMMCTLHSLTSSDNLTLLCIALLAWIQNSTLSIMNRRMPYRLFANNITCIRYLPSLLIMGIANNSQIEHQKHILTNNCHMYCQRNICSLLCMVRIFGHWNIETAHILENGSSKPVKHTPNHYTEQYFISYALFLCRSRGNDFKRVI